MIIQALQTVLYFYKKNSEYVIVCIRDKYFLCKWKGGPRQLYLPSMLYSLAFPFLKYLDQWKAKIYPVTDQWESAMFVELVKHIFSVQLTCTSTCIDTSYIQLWLLWYRLNTLNKWIKGFLCRFSSRISSVLKFVYVVHTDCLYIDAYLENILIIIIFQP